MVTLSTMDMIKSSMITAAMAIVTNIINFILSTSIELLSDMERHKSKTDRLASLIIKIIITQTINTAFIYYILLPKNPLYAKGLYSAIFDLVLISGFLTIVLQMFPPSYIVKKIINAFKYGP